MANLVPQNDDGQVAASVVRAESVVLFPARTPALPKGRLLLVSVPIYLVRTLHCSPTRRQMRMGSRLRFDERNRASQEASAARACVGKVKLVGDVDKNGGAARGDTAAGDEQKQAGQKELHLEGGGQPRRVAKEFGGEVLGVIVGVLAGKIGSGTQGEVAETEPELRIRAGKAAALPIGEAMVAAGGFAIDFGVRRQ
jgi:hypothetical protein